jgi:hypothetical protein
MKRFSTIFFWLITLAATGQDLPSNPLDDLYTPLKGSILDGEGLKNGNSSSGSRSTSTNDSKNLVGMNVSMLLRGVACFNYERILSNNFSVGASLGLAYGRDRIGYFTQLLVLESEDSEDYFTRPGFYQFRNSYQIRKVHPFFQLQAKYFLDSDPYDGTYLALMYRNYSNSMNYGGFGGQELDFQTPDYKVNMQGYTLLYGNSAESGSGKVIHDLYIGFGYKTNTFPLFDVEFNKNNPYSTDFNNASSFSPSGEKAGFSNFMFLFGYSLNFSL